ncbi:MAG: hypothetical protein IJW21_02455 [Clostridia bacterium]|nr:hypothetical protein [Clostridia bacterium]
MQEGKEDEAEEYINKLIAVLERHMSFRGREQSALLHDAEFPAAPVKEQSIKKILCDLQKSPLLQKFKPRLSEIYEKYRNLLP